MRISPGAIVMPPFCFFPTEITMDLREEIRMGLLRHALGPSLNEAKNVGNWWDALALHEKKKVARLLGFKMGKKVSFTALSFSVQSELEAYYIKHKGKIESSLGR